MPLTLDEVIALSDDAIQLGLDLKTALSAMSEGGKRITKAERKDLLTKTLALVKALAVDIAD